MNSRVVAAVLLLVSAPVAAEVSVDRPAGGGVVLHFEPSEIGPWSRVRAGIPSADLLNPQGDLRGDGWPVFSTGPTGLPSVAHGTPGDDGEIFLSWHDGTSWRPSRNISTLAGADFNPGLTVDADGNRFVAWNNTRGSRIGVRFVGVRNDGTAQTNVAELTARQREGRRPSIATYLDGDVYVAYEEQANGNDDVPYVAIDRVVPVRDPDRSLNCSGELTPDFSRSQTIRTCLTDRAMLSDVQVHIEEEHLWVTWIDNRTRVGWVELQAPGVFSPPSYRPYDPSLGPDSALDEVRDQVLMP